MLTIHFSNTAPLTEEIGFGKRLDETLDAREGIFEATGVAFDGAETPLGRRGTSSTHRSDYLHAIHMVYPERSRDSTHGFFVSAYFISGREESVRVLAEAIRKAEDLLGYTPHGYVEISD